MEKKIRFRDLSVPIKIAICMSWGIGILWSLAFLMGFMLGLLGLY